MESYRKKLRQMTERELYDSAKRMLVQEGTGKTHNGKRCDCVYDECERRNAGIFAAAVSDALITISSLETLMNGMKVVELKRIDYMTNHELRGFLQSIGAARRGHPLTGGGAMTATLEDMLGVRADAMMLCRVEGHSMTDANIRDGDMLVVDTTPAPADGDIIVVKYEGDLFVKRYRAFGKEVVLVSENQAYPNFRVRPGDDIHVFGVVKRVISDVSIK